MTGYPRVIAHRCGGVLAPENSLAGLEIAAGLGCRAVEFDVMLTADSVPILMHDATLDRTTRCRGLVAEHGYAEIRAVDPRVPRLDEVMTVCRKFDMWVNIELKPTAGREERTGEIVGRWLADHWHGRGVVSSFSEKSTLAARRQLPHASFAMLCGALPEDWQSVCAGLGAVAVHLDAEHAAAAAPCLQAAGIAWACYTVNTQKAAECLFSLGCHAVFTDRPDLLLPAFA